MGKNIFGPRRFGDIMGISNNHSSFLLVRLRLIIAPQGWTIGTTQYHAQLGLPDKGRAIKGLVV